MQKEIVKAHKEVRKVKNRIVLPVLIALTGFYVFITADVQKEVLGMFLGGVGSFSLLTLIFLVAGMLKNQSFKDAVKPYVAVFGLLLIWSVALVALRLVVKF